MMMTMMVRWQQQDLPYHHFELHFKMITSFVLPALNSAHLNGSIPLIGCQFDDTLNFELEMFQVFAYALFYVSTVLWIFNRYLQSVWLLCYAQQTDYYNRWNIFVKHCLSLLILFLFCCFIIYLHILTSRLFITFKPYFTVFFLVALTSFRLHHIHNRTHHVSLTQSNIWCILDIWFRTKFQWPKIPEHKAILDGVALTARCEYCSVLYAILCWLVLSP